MGFLLKLFIANPAAILYVGLAIAAAAGSVGAYGGWTLNGWRLSGQVEQLKGDKKSLEDQVIVLGESTRACSAAVDQAKKMGDLAVGQIREHLAELRKLHAGNATAVDRLEALIKKGTPAGAGCDKAWDAVEADWKARAP